VTARTSELLRAWLNQFPTILTIMLALWSYSLRIEQRFSVLETRAIALEARLVAIESAVSKLRAYP
jgi:hypothetical protein